VAEVALAIIDAYQGCGLGRMLLALLYRSARRHGLTCSAQSSPRAARPLRRVSNSSAQYAGFVQT
jgi:GNAT superfamily N-acetyltransferase